MHTCDSQILHGHRTAIEERHTNTVQSKAQSNYIAILVELDPWCLFILCTERIEWGRRNYYIGEICSRNKKIVVPSTQTLLTNQILERRFVEICFDKLKILLGVYRSH